jgi:hypothetical protein
LGGYLALFWDPCNRIFLVEVALFEACIPARFHAVQPRVDATLKQAKTPIKKRAKAFLGRPIQSKSDFLPIKKEASVMVNG